MSTVHIVMDPEFGARLEQIPAAEPIWVVQSPANNAVVAMLRHKGQDVSTFVPTHTVEELFPIVREHHPYLSHIEVHARS